MAPREKFRIITSPRHAIFFFTFFLLGAAMLSVAKVIPLPIGLERFIIVGLSVGLMLAYCFFVTVVPATRLRMDVAADNMYYLGFLYTLSSLAVALTVDNTDEILANFGVAISSTLIGIAARVSLNQLRVDPQDVEAATRLELSEATSRIRAELDDTVFQLSNFRTMNLQVMAEGYEEVKQHVEKASSEIFISIKELLEKSAVPLDILNKQTIEASGQLIESIDALKESHRGVTSSNRYMVDQIEKATRALQSISEYYADKGIIDEKILSEVRNEIEKLQAQITREARDEFNSLSQAVGKTREAAEKLEDVHKRLSQETNAELKSLTEATEKTREISKNIGDQQAELVQKTRNDLKTVTDTLVQSQQGLGDIKDLHNQVKTEIQDELKTIRTTVEKSLEASNKIETQQGKFKSETQNEMRTIKASIINTVSVSEKIEKNLVEVHRELKKVKEDSTAELVTKDTLQNSATNLTDFDVKTTPINEPTDIDENAVSSPSKLHVFDKQNGYDIFRSENGQTYLAEGENFDSIADAREAMDKLEAKSD
jgi:hypothetical protein